MNLKTHIYQRFNEFSVLALLTFACIILMVVRIKLTGTFFMLFLGGNLFLSMIPFSISVLVYTYPKAMGRWITILPITIAWLLFLPNAPYILTDVVHLGNHRSFSLWFDGLLVGAFSFTGLLFGLFSMRNMYELLQMKFSKKQLKIIFGAICFLCSFGIYLGRIQRWNSWDALLQPEHLFKGIMLAIQRPLCWVITLGFGFILWVGFRFVVNSKKDVVEFEKIIR